MKTALDFENDPEYNKLDVRERLAILKAHVTGRDSKTGRYLKGHSGNYGGRPKARTNTKDCLSLVLSQKTIATINGKQVRTTLLQAFYYKLAMSALKSDDPKLLMMAYKCFFSNVDISKDMPDPKIKPLKRDPSVDMIIKDIFGQTDKEFGVNTNNDNDSNLIDE